MALIQYIFQRGEPITLGDRIEAGTPDAGHTMRARMKLAAPQHPNVMPGGAAVSPGFSSTFVAASGGAAAYWLHSLTAEQSLTLVAGEYLFDSSLLLAGVTVWTSDPVRIVLRESASAVA